jgi:DNA-binding MarR family transcriptional regulator
MTQNDTDLQQFSADYSLQPGDLELIMALASGKSQQDAARTAKVSRSTVSRRLEDVSFRREVDRVRRELFDSAIGQLSGATAEATATLRKLLGGRTPATVRLGAARAIIDFAFKQRENEIMAELQQRIEMLEQLLKAQGQKV